MTGPHIDVVSFSRDDYHAARTMRIEADGVGVEITVGKNHDEHGRPVTSVRLQTKDGWEQDGLTFVRKAPATLDSIARWAGDEHQLSYQDALGLATEHAIACSILQDTQFANLPALPDGLATREVDDEIAAYIRAMISHDVANRRNQIPPDNGSTRREG